MQVSSFEKFTLLDYPGKLVVVVFTPGCVFRCPFCHNPELVKPTDAHSQHLFLNNRETEFFTFLETRIGKLDGVCITGGEPTLQKDLINFIRTVKEKGFLVKLDTNGIFPDIVEAILDTGLVDYWAMDIKHAPEKYPLATGRNLNMLNIQRSVDLLMTRAKDYEFRTTIVPSIHEVSDFDAIGTWIHGAKHYALQKFRDGKIIDPYLTDRAKGKTIDLNSVRTRLLSHVDFIEIRE